ncbi:MAG: hypothetical protein KAH48_10005, partial [Chlorobi bacterium]|nr:hypothetical protein [Chlorobiota bacterium]
MTRIDLKKHVSISKILLFTIIYLFINNQNAESTNAAALASDISTAAIYTIHCEVFNNEERPVIGANARLAETVLG